MRLDRDPGSQLTLARLHQSLQAQSTIVGEKGPSEEAAQANNRPYRRD